MIVPPRLVALAGAGIWPTKATELQQNLENLVPAHLIRLLAPEEERLYLYPIESLRTIAQRIESHESFWVTHGRLDQIDPGLSLNIGDFGLGSDAPIILDYRDRPTAPTVMRLKWDGGPAQKPETGWIRCAESLDDFVERLGLGSGRAV